MSESVVQFCIVPQFKISDGRKREESVKDEVGSWTAAGPDGPIAPGPLPLSWHSILGTGGP